MPNIIRKVISGGQTGADITGLRVAYELGIETGGTVPKDCGTEDGPNYDLVGLYGCIESEIPGYWDRTLANVLDSTGTVLFGIMSGGTKLTKKMCQYHKKPFIANPTGSQLRNWLKKHHILILNVAGNSYSKNPDVVSLTRNTLTEALKPEQVKGA